MALHPAYEVRDGAGPPIVLIHGALSSNRQWAPNLPALSKVGRPVLVELFGHGGSPSPEAPEAYYPGSYAEALEAIRNELGASAWHLVGYSLGARLTFEYALTHPARVLSHVVTNSMSAFATPSWIEATRRAMGPILADVKLRGREAIEAMPIHPRNSRRLDPEMRDGLCRDLDRCDPLGVALTTTETALSSPLGKRMCRNTVPTLLTCGKFEERFLERRDWAVAEVPELVAVDLEAGHAVNVEAADAWNEAVTRFLVRHRAPRNPA